MLFTRTTHIFRERKIFAFCSFIVLHFRLPIFNCVFQCDIPLKAFLDGSFILNDIEFLSQYFDRKSSFGVGISCDIHQKEQNVEVLWPPYEHLFQYNSLKHGDKTVNAIYLRYCGSLTIVNAKGMDSSY